MGRGRIAEVGFSYFNRLFATNDQMVQNSPAGGQAYVTILALGHYNKGQDWLRSLCFNVPVRDGMVLQWNGVIRITLS